MTTPELPLELIAHCFSFVEDIHTLAAICRTDKFGHRVATPRLYSNVGVLGNARRLYRLQCLCQRFIEHPELAERVHSVTQDIQENKSPVPGDQLVLDKDRCMTLCVTEKNLASAVCRILCHIKFYESDLVLLLLVLCPKLKVLRLIGEGTSQRLCYRNRMRLTLKYIGAAHDSDTEPNNSWEGDGSAVAHNAGLYTIEELSICRDPSLTAEHFFALLNMPGLRTLSLESFASPKGLWDPEDVTGFLRDIRIRQCRCDNVDIINLLRGCPFLLCLDISFDTPHEAHCRLNWPELGEEIESLAGTMTTMKFDYHRDSAPGAEGWPLSSLHGIGPLAHMKCLTSLTIPKSALCARWLYTRSELGEPVGISDEEMGIAEESVSEDEDGLELEGEDGLGPHLPSQSEAFATGGASDRDSVKLPDSLKHLEVLCECEYLDRDEILAALRPWWNEHIESLTLINRTKTQVIHEIMPKSGDSLGNSYTQQEHIGLELKHHALCQTMKIDLSYHYLTHHVVPGPQSISYFLPLLLLPIALSVPRSILSKRQNAFIFLPIMTVSTIHAWYLMAGTDVISADVLFQGLFFLVFQDLWRDYQYVATFHEQKQTTPLPEPTCRSDEAEVIDGDNSSISIKPVDRKQSSACHGQTYPEALGARIAWVLNLLSCIRLNNWRIGNRSHDARQPPQPAFRTRSKYFQQSMLSFIRGYIVLDLTRAYIAYDPYFTDVDIPISSELPFNSVRLIPSQLLRTMVVGAQAWALISQMFYLPALVPVGLNALGLLPAEWSPHNWVPFFGPASIIFKSGVRGFWGGYWHQTMRWMTTGPGYALSDALKLRQKSALRYAIISASAFGLSGITHMGLVPPEPPYATASVNAIRLYVAGFFWLQPLAMMAEIMVIKLLVRWCRPDLLLSRQALVLRAVFNAVWVVAWFSLCIPLLGEAGRQLGYWRVWPMPISVWKGMHGEGWVKWPFLLS